jgi:hypothetical protein
MLRSSIMKLTLIRNKMKLVMTRKVNNENKEERSKMDD